MRRGGLVSPKAAIRQIILQGDARPGPEQAGPRSMEPKSLSRKES